MSSERNHSRHWCLFVLNGGLECREAFCSLPPTLKFVLRNIIFNLKIQFKLSASHFEVFQLLFPSFHSDREDFGFLCYFGWSHPAGSGPAYLFGKVRSEDVRFLHLFGGSTFTNLQ